MFLLMSQLLNQNQNQNQNSFIVPQTESRVCSAAEETTVRNKQNNSKGQNVKSS